MPSSVVLPKSQALAVEALIGSGSYKTQSEIFRSAVEEFILHVPKPTRLAAAVWAYENGKASLSQAAALAGIEHEAMQHTLVREGRWRGGLSANASEAETEAPRQGASMDEASKRTAASGKMKVPSDRLRRLVRARREEILSSARRHGALEVQLFGSAARGDANESSDIDFLVRFEPGRSLLDQIGLKQELEELLGVRVDVVSTGGLSPYIRDAVLREATAL